MHAKKQRPKGRQTFSPLVPRSFKINFAGSENAFPVDKSPLDPKCLQTTCNRALEWRPPDLVRELRQDDDDDAVAPEDNTAITT